MRFLILACLVAACLAAHVRSYYYYHPLSKSYYYHTLSRNAYYHPLSRSGLKQRRCNREVCLENYVLPSNCINAEKDSVICTKKRLRFPIG
ncbi:hypothetical protein TELCIR_07086 [Teladorsagia circumcincta]|uniref:Uncharacterized protein n=1 Tax=Teladorsagia circumcincta TaxID=45464 RepID=A0A2G9UL83_TELCI|nr:hypothetical protein TELCIR_07086 [Teladorsagia circumcincta]